MLYANSLAYNGLSNSYTNTAQKLLDMCKQLCEQSEHVEQMQHLEEAIAVAFEQGAVDSRADPNRASVESGLSGSGGGPETSAATPTCSRYLTGASTGIDSDQEQQQQTSRPMSSSSFSAPSGGSGQQQPSGVKRPKMSTPAATTPSSMSAKRHHLMSQAQPISQASSDAECGFVDIEGLDEQHHRAAVAAAEAAMMSASALDVGGGALSEQNIKPIYLGNDDEEEEVQEEEDDDGDDQDDDEEFVDAHEYEQHSSHGGVDDDNDNCFN